jgi:hypothetical protein
MEDVLQESHSWLLGCCGVGHAALGSDIIRAEGNDKFGGLPVDLSLSLQVLWKPAAPRLNQRLVCLRLMPVSCGTESGIPASLEH